jgi:ABC-type phosphate transport system substrate-binding protein
VAKIAVTAAAVALALAPAASSPALATQYVNINGEGSSWAAPAWQQWQADAGQSNVTFNYTPNGSSAGRDDFAQRTQAMFADSEIPFTGDANDPQDQTVPSFGYAMLPIVAGGTAFGYNLPVGGVQYTQLKLNMATIAGIFSGLITKWNAPQIAATNPGVTLPDHGITVVVRSDGSGATAQFKLWMLRQFPADYRSLATHTGGDPNHASSYYPVGSLACGGSSSACFVSQQGATGVTTYTKNNPYSIDYDEYAYNRTYGVPAAQVQNAHGFFTLPDEHAVAVALIAAKINTNTNSPNYLSQDLSNVYGYMDPRTYPMSLYSYEMIPTQTTGVLQDPQGATLAWVSTNAVCEWQKDMGGLGYSPLPMNLVLASMQQIERLPGIDAATKGRITQTQQGVNSGTSNPCNSPTFQPGQSPSDNLLVKTAPFPPGCDAACQAPWIGKTSGSGPNSGGGGSSNPGGGSNNPGGGSNPGGGGTNPGGGTGPAGATNGPSRTASPTGGTPGATGPQGGPGAGAGTPSSGPTCNAATGVCTSPSAGQSAGLADPGASNQATIIPAANGWTTPQTMGTMVIILLLAVLIAPPVVLTRTRRGRRE